MSAETDDVWKEVEEALDGVKVEEEERLKLRESEQREVQTFIQEAEGIIGTIIRPALEKAVGLFQARGYEAKVDKAPSGRRLIMFLEVTAERGTSRLVFEIDPSARRFVVSHHSAPSSVVDIATNTRSLEPEEITEDTVVSEIKVFGSKTLAIWS